MRINKKYFLVLFLVLISLISISTKLDNYVYSFEPSQLIRKNDNSLNSLGLYLKYIETGNQEYKNTANMLRAENIENLSADDSTALNILSESIPNNYNFIQNKLKNALNNYSNSIILNGLYTVFTFKVWEEERNLSTEQIIIDQSKFIEDKIGINPLSAYHYSYIKWYSKYISEPGKSFDKLEEIYRNFPENKTIIELLTTISYESHRFEYLENLYQIYSNLNEKNNSTLLIFAKGFSISGEDKKVNPILENIINDADDKYVLASTYELMGDISNTNSQKIKYYEKSLEYDSHNPDSLYKLAKAHYDKNGKTYLNLVRIYLQKSIHYDNNNEEAVLLLKKINYDFMVENFLINILPYFLIFSFIFFLFYYYINKKPQKERDEIINEEQKD
ncbi:MAG: tetratricopeptide repeat protein [Thermotogota bacterium]